MATQSPALSMSQIISSDAPLLSPTENSWDFNPDSFNYYYPSSQHSPISAEKVLKIRLSPESSSDQESLCVSTQQLFDLAETKPQVAAPPPPPVPQHPVLAAVSTASKRSASPAATGASKKRATGERVSSKDFIPPDVTGLSKREARLVKNRAAAFLSRQRKREEFETMEVRVAELEQENARLLALTKNGSSMPPSDSVLVSEVEQLRAQLAAAQERERQLSAQLDSRASSPQNVPIKLEASESYVPASPSRPVSGPAPNKTAASLGLMQVLLCALPTLLSMPMQSATSTNFSVPSQLSTLNYDFNQNMIPNDFDWTRTSLMDLDSDERNKFSAASLTRKLEFAGIDANGLGDLGGLDISFDTSSTDNGKIRVRIHPSSSASSRAGSPGVASSSSPKADAAASPMDMWSPEYSSQDSSPTLSQLSTSDPFLGIDYGSSTFNDMTYRMNDLDDGTLSDFGLGSEYSVPDTNGGKRRVRIALKNPPSPSNEGGEWEVEIC